MIDYLPLERSLEKALRERNLTLCNRREPVEDALLEEHVPNLLYPANALLSRIPGERKRLKLDKPHLFVRRAIAEPFVLEYRVDAKSPVDLVHGAAAEAIKSRQYAGERIIIKLCNNDVRARLFGTNAWLQCPTLLQITREINTTLHAHAYPDHTELVDRDVEKAFRGMAERIDEQALAPEDAVSILFESIDAFLTQDTEQIPAANVSPGI